MSCIFLGLAIIDGRLLRILFGAQRALRVEEVHAWIYFPSSIDTHVISLSFRQYTHLFANAGCDHTTGRFASLFVGSIACARLISSYPFGLIFAMIKSP